MTDDHDLATRIADLEHELLDHDDLPRIAQALRAHERTELENRLADLRRRRDETTTDDAA